MTIPHSVDHPSISIDRLIWAIEQVESGGDWSKRGGALQFTIAIWAEETRLPYLLSQHKQQAENIAAIRLSRIQATCVRFSVTPTVLLLAEAWHKGTASAMKRAKTGRFTDHAQSVANFYFDKSQAPF